APCAEPAAQFGGSGAGGDIRFPAQRMLGSLALPVFRFCTGNLALCAEPAKARPARSGLSSIPPDDLRVWRWWSTVSASCSQPRARARSAQQPRRRPPSGGSGASNSSLGQPVSSPRADGFALLTPGAARLLPRILPRVTTSTSAGNRLGTAPLRDP